VALNQIALARLQAQPPGLGDTTGEVELANRRWTWKQTVGQTDAPGIFRIDVSVRPADVAPPKGDKDSGWFATVSGIRGNDLTIGTVSVSYGDITTACEQFGLSSTQTPYALPPGINCNAIGPSGAGGTVRPNPGNSSTPRRSGGTEGDAAPPSDGPSEPP